MKKSSPTFPAATALLATAACFCLSWATLLTPNDLQAQPRSRGGTNKPPPDLADFQYGTHARHVLDLWKAKSERPTPLVVFIHGGGFRGGDKSGISPALIKGCLDNGVSVMAINYRLSPEVKFPAHYRDCARAIQLARSQARNWNLDPNRFGATGGSAGAGTSLWLAFHPDLAETNSSDAVLRQSTRLRCVAVVGAQSTYDPRVIRQWIGTTAADHPALGGFYGLTPEEFDSPKAHELYEAASPINFLTADDPPVMLFYSEADQPLPANAPPGAGIHHPIFGKKLKEKMQGLNLECVLTHRTEYANDPAGPTRDMVKFLVKHLQVPPP
jgi:acetyl esterase/lipase